MPWPALAMPDARREALRTALPGTVDLLKQRRASAIAPLDIEDYIALHWFEWNGGSLRLTDVGRNVCKQVAAGLS